VQARHPDFKGQNKRVSFPSLHQEQGGCHFESLLKKGTYCSGLFSPQNAINQH
jgi:hypothetical protein